MMTKMKKMNVLNYQVTRFARDKYFVLDSAHALKHPTWLYNLCQLMLSTFDRLW